MFFLLLVIVEELMALVFSPEHIYFMYIWGTTRDESIPWLSLTFELAIVPREKLRLLLRIFVSVWCE